MLTDLIPERIIILSMALDWTKLFKKYKGLWVALLDDEKTVVESGTTAASALKQSQFKGYSIPILTRIPDSLSAFVVWC